MQSVRTVSFRVRIQNYGILLWTRLLRQELIRITRSQANQASSCTVPFHSLPIGTQDAEPRLLLLTALWVILRLAVSKHSAGGAGGWAGKDSQPSLVPLTATSKCIKPI